MLEVIFRKDSNILEDIFLHIEWHNIMFLGHSIIIDIVRTNELI
jgi:hypothetical protein